MNDIRKLIELTSKEDHRDKSAARFFMALLWMELAIVFFVVVVYWLFHAH